MQSWAAMASYRQQNPFSFLSHILPAQGMAYIDPLGCLIEQSGCLSSSYQVLIPGSKKEIDGKDTRTQFSTALAPFSICPRSLT